MTPSPRLGFAVAVVAEDGLEVADADPQAHLLELVLEVVGGVVQVLGLADQRQLPPPADPWASKTPSLLLVVAASMESSPAAPVPLQL